jgi:tripartite ATP-independent transporter DctM subunit
MMDPLTLGIVVGVVSLIFLLSGMPIAFALGFVAIIFIVIFMGPSQFDLVANTLFDGLENFGLLAIPLFILLGTTIGNTKASSDLYEVAHRWLYRLPGGLGVSNLISCAIFAALCGSSPATAAAIGKMGIPEMRKRGYSASLACGIIAAGGTLGILIPPSVTMIVYGIATETSIGKLFIAGIIPGILLTAMFSVWVVLVYHFTHRLPQKVDNNEIEYYTMKEKLIILPKVIPFILIIVIIIISLYGGWATPSESAAVGAIAAMLLVGIIYRVSLKEYISIIKDSTNDTVMIMLIIATSFLFGTVLTKLYISQTIANLIVSLDLPRWILMLLINIFLLVLGCFMPPVAIILITSPILYPVVTGLGFDPLWFGVIMTINLEAGLITPPVGLNLFVIKGIAPDVPLGKVLRGSLPFIIIILLEIVILYLFPGLALWLPNKMIGG